MDPLLVSSSKGQKFKYQYNNLQTMTNNKIQKKLVSFGTQFSSTDLYFDSQEHNDHHIKEKVQMWIQKEEERFLCQNEGKNSSSVSKQSKDEKKSLNHNFQKHAVVTIKKLMRMKYDASACIEQKIAHRMWNIFMVTDIKSKKLLVILFGTANLRDERNKQLFVKCGFEQIINQDQILIRKAQQILRKRFTETVTEEVIRQNIQNFRNIKATQEFLVYFGQLLNLIRKGPLLKLRINNTSAKKIQAEIINNKTRKQSSE